MLYAKNSTPGQLKSSPATNRCFVMVRDCVQWSPILIVVSRDDAYDVGVRAHDDLSVVSWDASPFTVSNDTGDKIDPTIEIES